MTSEWEAPMSYNSFENYDGEYKIIRIHVFKLKPEKHQQNQVVVRARDKDQFHFLESGVQVDSIQDFISNNWNTTNVECLEQVPHLHFGLARVSVKERTIKVNNFKVL